jgi:multiple sugar transport system substrate-binding protein
MSQHLTRRVLLRRSAVGMIGLASTALLAACGGSVGATESGASASATAVSSAAVATAAATTNTSRSAIASSAPPPSTVSSAAPQPATATPAQAGNAVVFWTNASYPYKGQVGAQLVQQYEQQGGATIAYTDTSYSDFMNKLLTTVAAGTPPDLSYVDDYVPPSYACRGVLAALDDMMAQSKVIRPDVFWPGLVARNTHQGKWYGIPHGTDVGLLYYNQDLFQAGGLDATKPPTTWDAAITTAQRLTRKSGTTIEQVGWSPAEDWGVPWLVPYWQQGGLQTNADETQATLANDQAAAALDLFKKVYDSEASIDEVQAFTKAAGGVRKAFTAGKVALHWDTHATIHSMDVAKVTFKWGASYYPLPPSGQHANYISGWSLVIPKGAKNPNGAFQFLEFLCGTGPQVAWALAWNNEPAVVAAAQSSQFLGANPLNQLAVAESAGAKYVITAPGADKIINVEAGVTAQVVSGKQSAHDALSAANALVQQDLTDAAKSCAV